MKPPLRIVLIKTGRRSARQHYAPPLGAMSLASFLRDRRPGTEIKIIDMLVHGLSAADAVRQTLEFAPDLVGLSVMSYEAEGMAELAAALKKQRPDLPLIAGGPHPTTAPDRTLAVSAIDYIVRGEGEITLLEFIDRVLIQGQDPAQIQGLGFRRDGAIVLTAPREEMVDIDAISLPAYDLIDLPAYWRLPRFGTTYVHERYACVFSSRACPYHCTYCHRLFGTRFRAQKPETVLRDLATLYHQFGVREIQFIDDCFNLDKDRVRAICSGIRDQGLHFSISFPNGLRGDLMDESVLDALKAAGAYRITYAIETASPRLQQFIKKNVKLDKLKQVIAWTDDRDIMADGFFMLGFPTETRQEIQLTIDYALSSRLTSANFWFVTPFPGTELHRQAKELGLSVVDAADSLHYFDPATSISEVGPDELKSLVQKTFIRFYANPHRLLRILSLFPNKAQLPSLLLRAIAIALKWN
jgi:anaerobic magnesium-protoporphyrin IX monomethyl ester cyclase